MRFVKHKFGFGGAAGAGAEAFRPVSADVFVDNVTAVVENKDLGDKSATLSLKLVNPSDVERVLSFERAAYHYFASLFKNSLCLVNTVAVSSVMSVKLPKRYGHLIVQVFDQATGTRFNTHHLVDGETRVRCTITPTTVWVDKENRTMGITWTVAQRDAMYVNV